MATRMKAPFDLQMLSYSQKKLWLTVGTIHDDFAYLYHSLTAIAPTLEASPPPPRNRVTASLHSPLLWY